MSCFFRWTYPLSLILVSTVFAAAQTPIGLPKPLTEKDFDERAKVWVRKLQLATNPAEYDYCRKNMIALGAKAVPSIIKAVKKEEGRAPWLHWNVALVLGKIGDDRALPYLLDRIKPVPAKQLKQRPEWTYVRAFAALALGKIKDPAKTAIPPLRLIAANKDESRFLRRAVFLALGALRDKKSAKFFGDIVRDPQADSTMRGAAALALGIGCEDKGAEHLASYHALKEKDKDPLTSRLVVLATGLLRKERTAALLRALLASADEPDPVKVKVKRRANIGDRRVHITSGLEGLLTSQDDTLRGTTALVLAWLNDRASASAVMRVMKDPFAPGFTRCNAAVALGELGKRKEGGEFLQQVLVDMLNGSKKNSYGTLAYAAIGLAQFPGEDTLKLLYTVAGKKTAPRVVALNAYIALGHLKDPRLVPFQIKQYQVLGGTSNAYHRGEILRALISHPPQQAIRRLLIDALRRDGAAYVRQRAAIGLARYPGSDTDHALSNQLGDRDWETRGQVALSLGVLKAKSAIGKLRTVMKNDKSDWVRLCARKALENIIKYGDHPTWQTSGLQKLIDKRLFRVGASLKDEIDRMYTFAYNNVLELSKPYTANTEVD